MIFDPNKEKFRKETSQDKTEKRANPIAETAATNSTGQENLPPRTDSSMQDMEITKPAEQVNSNGGPSPAVPAEQPQKAQNDQVSNPPEQVKPFKGSTPPAESVKKLVEPSPVGSAEPSKAVPNYSAANPMERAKPLPADKSSTEPGIKVVGKTDKPKPVVPTAPKTNKKIIAVGGAKGGVGKSMLSANLAVGLALLGQNVVLADLDLGGADVHLYTGVKNLVRTWNDFLDKKVDSIKDILTPTAFKGLSLIGGDSSRLGSANLAYSQKLKIMRHLKELETDFLVVDLGGDTTYNGLDFFLLADQKIVVSGTEPASVLDSYTFVKVVFNRFLERFFSERKNLKKLAEQIRDGSLEKQKNYSLEFIYQEVRARDPQAMIHLKEQFDQFRLSIVLNMTENTKDVRIAESMQKLVKEKCFLDIGILGTIPFEKAVRKAARGFTPIVVENPKCQASRNIHQMLAAIIFHREQDATRAELLQTAGQIRREAKEQIDSGNMTLDGLTIGQINSVFNSTPRLRNSFRKILNIMTG